MRPALTTTLPPKTCSANPFSLPHVAATQEIRESFLTLTATMVVKPTPPFLSACSNNDSGRGMTTTNHAPRKTNPKTKQTHFLFVRSHAPEPQVREFPASPSRATHRPRAPEHVSFLAKLSRLAKKIIPFFNEKFARFFQMDLSVVSAFKKYYFGFFFLVFFPPPENPKKMKNLLVLKYFRHFSKKLKTNSPTSRPRYPPRSRTPVRFFSG
jgi:hypothetical protein